MPGKPHLIPDFTAHSQHIDPDWITNARLLTGTASVRCRKLPVEQVVWMIIALAMYRHTSIPDVVTQLELPLPDPINLDIAKAH